MEDEFRLWENSSRVVLDQTGHSGGLMRPTADAKRSRRWFLASGPAGFA